MEVRAYVDPDDTRPMQELQSRVWPLGLHPGGLGWTLATHQLGEQTFVAVADNRVVGWVALPGGGELAAQVEPGFVDAGFALLDRALDVASDRELRVGVTDADETLRAVLVQRGFSVGSTATYGMWMDAADWDTGSSPGYSIRSVRPDELAARVEVHRAAWRPSDMPWPVGARAQIDPEATSSFTEEKYARCRATWLYDPDFDLVAVAADGRFAASCLAWFDPRTGVAEVEPMGVHADHRRKGIAGALCHEVAKRVAALGGSQVFINSGPNAGYPAPPAAYTKAGFRTVRRGMTYVRPRS